MSKLGDHREAMKRPQERFRRAPGGPFTVERTEHTTIVTNAQASQATIHAVGFNGRSEVADALATGVDVTIDDASVGRLSQIDHGVLRADRVIRFDPSTPSDFPPAPIFRLRRMRAVVCENDSGHLIAPPVLLPLGFGQLNVAQGVPAELLLIYVGVQGGLQVALSY